MRTFKFNSNVAPPGGYQRNTHYNERSSGQIRNSGRTDNHNHAYGQGRGDDMRDNGGNHGSYNSNFGNR